MLKTAKIARKLSFLTLFYRERRTPKRKVSGSNPLGNAREPPPSGRRLFVTGRRLTLGVISFRINGLRGKGEYVMFRIDPASREGLPCGIAAGAALASRGFRKHRVTPFFGLLPALRAANGGRNRARTKIARDENRARTNIVRDGIRARTKIARDENRVGAESVARASRVEPHRVRAGDVSRSDARPPKR